MNAFIFDLWYANIAVKLLCLVLLFRRRLAGRYWELVLLVTVNLASAAWQRIALWRGGAGEYNHQWFDSEPFLIAVYSVVALAAFGRLGKFYRVGRGGVVMAAVFVVLAVAAVLSTQSVGVIGWDGAPRIVFLARQFVGIVFLFLLLGAGFLRSFQMNVPANVIRHIRILKLYFLSQLAGLVLLNLDMPVAASFPLVGLTMVCYVFWCLGIVPEGERYEEEPLITEEECDRMLESGRRLSRNLAEVRKAPRSDKRNAFLVGFMG